MSDWFDALTLTDVAGVFAGIFMLILFSFVVMIAWDMYRQPDG